MYPFVIFDLDGTLLDTLKDLAGAGNHALSAMGLPKHPVDDFRAMVGNGIPTLVERMLPEQSRGKSTHELALQLFSSYYTAHKSDHTAPYPGIMKMLENLAQSGICMGIATNKDDAFCGSLVEDLFPGIFTAVVGLKEGTAPKPDPSIVQDAMAQMGAGIYNTLYVGDSDVDMLTAKNAGLTACGVLWGFRSKEELLDSGADLLAEDAKQLESYILK